MEIFGYLVFIFGVVGIGLGLYGLLMPVLKRQGFNLNLSWLKLPRRAAETEDEYEDPDMAVFQESPFQPRVQPAQPFLPPKITRAADPPAAVQQQPVALRLAADTAPQADPLAVDEEVAALLEDIGQELQSVSADPPPEDEEQTGEEAAVPAAAKNDAGADFLALFDETSATSTVPSTLRDSMPDVAIHDLLAEARQLRELLGIEDTRTGAA